MFSSSRSANSVAAVNSALGSTCFLRISFFS
jgi:hypothetical protein